MNELELMIKELEKMKKLSGLHLGDRDLEKDILHQIDQIKGKIKLLQVIREKLE